ncbi:MAG TPA: class I SAM-dependent methyltransferase [Candidatus Aquicultor sp.]|jgi:SAM-dependent methyltransferase
MANTQYAADFLQSYGPQLPINELVIEMNKLYHACEASIYDTQHPEIHDQLPLLWQEMIEHSLQQYPNRAWRILDIGCGTGFEAKQLIQNLPQGSIESIVCYDPSLEMLDSCHSAISPIFPKAFFCSDLGVVPANQGPYNLLATNSLLHHLPNPKETINHVLPLLARNAIWLAGHEPSNRFYSNRECMENYERFLGEKRKNEWRRYFSPEKYLRRFKRMVGLENDFVNQIANEALHRGLFKRKPSASAIDLLVDFHVAHTIEEAEAGRGFDFEVLQQNFDGFWCLIYVKSYSFMGPYYEGNLSNRWLYLCRNLAYKFPMDGANFCSVWARQ